MNTRNPIRALLLPLLALSLNYDSPAQEEASTISWNHILEQADAWYGTKEASRIADNVLLYQNNNGGWPKNIDMARVLTENERTEISANRDRMETLIDNGATYTQMRFLARVYAATKTPRLKEGFVRGLDYLLQAQYENGGWPMVYPLRQGYYTHITFNDGAMIGVMRLLRDVAQNRVPYAWVDPDRRRRAEMAIEKGLKVILQCQVKVAGKPTVWCAQHDEKDLSCAKARSYELPSLSGAESVGIVEYLMELDRPSPEVIRAVTNAVQWFERVKLTGIKAEKRPDASLPKGYDVIVSPAPADAPPLWARFYEIGSNRPMFSGRDGVVRYTLSQIEYERRVGYAWLGSWARNLLEKDYPAWRKKWRVE